MSMPAPRLHASVSLTGLLHGIAGAPDIGIGGIASDTRQLGAGYLFLACAGMRSHGLDYAGEAVAAGAAAIAYDATTAPSVPDVDVPLVPVEHLRARLGDIANRFFQEPSGAVRVAGITGTNGKTTVAWLLAQCLNRLDRRCGYIGTLGSGIGDIDAAEGMTTPDVISLHRQLAEFRDAGAEFAAIEVSSHALAQDRIDGVLIDTALFTNLSRDHLDYHGDMAAYGDAKAALFTEAAPERRIINVDSEFGSELAARFGADLIVVSTTSERPAGGRPFVHLRSAVATAAGSDILIDSSWGEATMSLPLAGDFNVANAALVLAYLLADGIALAQAVAALEQVNAAPGRMQRVEADRGPVVYVDYAHTPGALEVALGALRSHCRGELWCVFGCGGERDTGKRPLMAGVAEELADRVVVTSDNPRGEDAGDIITAIVDGLRDRNRATVIEDRAAAIAWTIAQANPADTILLAGKGHENYQLVGAERRDWSDYGAAVANLTARYRKGEGDA
jgi:UDP-N-acetylmuramoyl-L-alanyl-D-glutamate--2,6-diaminopimelate ligase